MRCHRPADDPPAPGIEHDGEIEEAGPGRHVGDVGDPEPIGRASPRTGGRRDRAPAGAVWSAHRRAARLPPADALQAGAAHQPGDPLAADAHASGRELGVNAGGAVGPARRRGGWRCDLRRSAPHRPAPAPTAAAGARRSSRWGRRPARGTWCQRRWTAWCALTNSNPWTGSRRSPAQTRPRLLLGSSRSSRSCADFRAAAGAAPPAPRVVRPSRRSPASRVGLPHPVPDRLGRRLELARQVLGRPALANELHDAVPELRRVRRGFLGIVDAPFPPSDEVSTKPGQLQERPGGAVSLSGTRSAGRRDTASYPSCSRSRPWEARPKPHA